MRWTSEIKAVQHGGASVMVWCCFATSAPGCLGIIDGTMSSVIYWNVLKRNVQPTHAQAHLQQNNDPKHFYYFLLLQLLFHRAPSRFAAFFSE